MKNNLLQFIALCSLGFILFSCSKDVAVRDTTFTDAKFFALIQDSTGAGYYANTAGNTTFTSSVAIHQNLSYKFRMNAKALAACTASGKLPAGSTFPDSSLLVKVLSNGSGQIQEYAALYKLGGSWSWARYGASGNVLFSINDDANTTCVSCHTNPSRDNTWTFDVHP